jgi:hypothetical protein
MSASYAITLTHHTPEGFWSAMAYNAETKWILGGLYTSAEAALAACWLTTDERIDLPAIATYAQVRELLDARLKINEPDAGDDGLLLASQQDSAPGTVAACVTAVEQGVSV